MDTFEKVKSRLKELSTIRYEATNYEESVELLQFSKTTISELKSMKQTLIQEVKGIRNQYKEAKANASNKSHFISGLIFGRSTSGKLRAENKRNLSNQLDKEIEPYEKLKLICDDYIVQISNKKSLLENYIRENKSITAKKTIVKQDPNMEILNQIEKLGELRDKNIITDQEFENKKKELLNKLK
ncbi:MAG: SHOCT domain-containing protein [Saprospiraceae bacterium]|nr:SHOCT domain-containing protein [Saprospiraceae bacterium]